MGSQMDESSRGSWAKFVCEGEKCSMSLVMSSMSLVRAILERGLVEN